jgi:hypothetical protein
MTEWIYFFPVPVILSLVCLGLFLWKKPPNEGIGRVWRILFGLSGVTTAVHLSLWVYGDVMWRYRRQLAEVPGAWHFVPLKMLGQDDGWLMVFDVLSVFFFVWGLWLIVAVLRAANSELRRRNDITF